MQVGLHMVHLPQGQGDAGGKEVRETRSQAAQLETYPVAIKLNRPVEVLDQQTNITDGLIHASAWRCSRRRGYLWASGR